MPRLTPNGRSVRRRVASITSAISPGDDQDRGNIPSPPAFETAAANSAVTAPPIGANTTGTSIPTRSHSRVRTNRTYDAPPARSRKQERNPGEQTFHVACPRVAAGLMETDSAIVVPSSPVNDDRPSPPSHRSPPATPAVRLTASTAPSPEAPSEDSGKTRRVVLTQNGEPACGSRAERPDRAVTTPPGRSRRPHGATRRARAAPRVLADRECCRACVKRGRNENSANSTYILFFTRSRGIRRPVPGLPLRRW